MKKVLCALILVLIFASVSNAKVIGTWYPNIDEDAKEGLLAAVFDKDYETTGPVFKAYDSVTLMQLALKKGEIDVFTAPEFVGEYILRTNPEYKMRAFMITNNRIALSFGFLEEKKELRDRFNKVLWAMGDDGMNGIIARDFITGPKALNPKPVEFEKFDDAETVTVAVTGDMPPLDYVAADGEPAGFNTAMLAEIGRRLHVNIKIVNVESGSRAVALKSGRADVVFWFEIFEGYDKQPDIPEGVIVTTPYYGWNKAMLIGLKNQ